MAGKVQMQGRNVVTQELTTWLADAPDWTGEFSLVPVTDVTLYVRAQAAAATAPAMACAISSPAPSASLTALTIVTITGTISVAGTVAVKKTKGATTTALGPATVVGLSWSYSYTLLQSDDVGALTFGATATATIGGATGEATGVSVTVAAAFPATLPNLALWLAGAQAAYSDAGTTLAAVPYGRVQQIAQPGPLSGNWTASGAGRPWRDANALDMHYGNPSVLTQPASITIPGNNCTIAIAYEKRIDQVLGQLFSCTVGGINFGALSTNTQYLVNNGVTAPFGPTAPNGTNKVTLILTCTAGQILAEGTVNGTPYSVTLAAPAVGNLSAITLGQGLGFAGAGAISEFAVTAQALDSTQRAGLQAYLLANMPGEVPTSAPLLMMTGDSICAAWGSACQTALDGNATPPRVLNTGISGATCPTITGLFPTIVTPHYSALRAKNILVAEGISTNDMQVVPGGTAAAKAASVLAAYYAYCDMAKAAGWIVILCTLTPATAAVKPSAPDFEAARTIINTDIRANYLAHGHYLADIGGAPGIATPADAAGSNFLDGLHLAGSGYVIATGVLQPKVELALAA